MVFWRFRLFMVGPSVAKNTIYRKVQLASVKNKGVGHIETEEKCLFHFQSWSCDGYYFVDWRRICIFHPTVSPDRVYHSTPSPFSWKLRHNTQKVPATLPSVSHARLDSFVAACWWATAKDRDRDRKRQRERRRWVEVAL